MNQQPWTSLLAFNHWLPPVSWDFYTSVSLVMVVDDDAGTGGLGYAGRNLRYEIEKKKKKPLSVSLLEGLNWSNPYNMLCTLQVNIQ